MTNISGIVLAGGRSSRMGEDKGLMPLGGKPMVAHVLEQLRHFTDELIIIANNARYEQLGYRVVPDQVKDAGPVGGICTGLAVATTKFCFFASCDTPFITAAAIGHLLAARKDEYITVATLGGQMQPLFGLYSRHCQALFEASLQRQQLRLQSIVRETKHQCVPMDELAAARPQLFRNINTPEDYKAALGGH